MSNSNLWGALFFCFNGNAFMPNAMMTLSLENLDKIEAMLLISYEKSVIVQNSIDFDEVIIPSPEKRKMLNGLLESMGT